MVPGFAICITDFCYQLTIASASSGQEQETLFVDKLKHVFDEHSTDEKELQR